MDYTAAEFALFLAVLVSKRVLVLGASGMLGQQCYASCASQVGWEVLGTQRVMRNETYFDGDLDRLDTVLRSFKPQYIINCTAVLSRNIDPSVCTSKEVAIETNAMLPHGVARVAAQHGALLLHVSTDAVFSGKKGKPYDEADTPDPADVYGMTKLLGECMRTNALTVRCSIVGRDRLHGRGLVERLLATPAGETVIGFTNQVWNGVTALQLSDLFVRIIERDGFDQLRQDSPVYHFCPNPQITKYELLTKILTIARKDIRVRRGESPTVLNRVLSTRYSLLSIYHRAFTTWDELLRALFEGD